MHYIVRSSALVTFVVLTAFGLACSVSTAKKQTETNINKPLALPQKASDKPKIVAFGDSLTAGFGLAETESYPYLLQQKLVADGFDYEVVNAGVSGDTSLGGLERADWVLDNDNAKVVILELGANDLLRGIPVAKMKDNLDKIIRKAKAKNVQVLLCGMLAPATMGTQYQREYTTAFPDLASEHKLEFVPFLLDGVALDKNLNQADGIHPNAEGEKIMTDNIYKVLKPMLQK
ncbi:MAG TPA: arylesterase [Pyrinomonadaceae bacterium]|nr:arylesterase [Pyrinomonadaceae bacterium]